MSASDPIILAEVQNRIFASLAAQATESVHVGVASITMTDVEIRQRAFDTLFKILETDGHSIVCGWTPVFAILKSITRAPLAPASARRSSISSIQATGGAPTSANSRYAILVRVSFPSLQIVCTDFLAALSLAELTTCIECLIDFGRQEDDVNIALTSVGLLWQLSDHLQIKRNGSEDTATQYKDLWLLLLQKLLVLCVDQRQEVRDGAIQILFRSLELYGSTLDQQTWDACLWTVLFPLLDNINSASQRNLHAAVSPPSIDTAKVDASEVSSKQWDDTQILALNSICTLFADFLASSIMQTSRYDEAWRNLSQQLQKGLLQAHASVATACMKALERITSSLAVMVDNAGLGQAANDSLEVAWRSWQEIGAELILRSHKSTQQQSTFILVISRQYSFIVMSRIYMDCFYLF